MAKGWLDNIEKAQPGKKVPPETETAKAKKVARKVASTSGVGLVLDQFPGAETAYDLYNIVDGYKQGDPMKIIPNVMGALLPGLSGKAFEAITDEYLPKTPENEKKKIKAVLKGKRASTDEIRKAQESVDWSTGFKKLYDDAGEIGTDIKNTIDDTVSPLMGLKNGGWLDNYNDSEVSLPEGFVGEGIFNGPKFDNPAWGGQFQNGGTKKQIAESTSVYKKPFNNKELKNIIKDDTEKTRTGNIKNPRAEANKFEKYLPTKETVDFFRNIKKENTPAQFREALKIQHERGNPTINVGTNKGLPFHNKRNYNPFTNEINIPKPSEYNSNLDNFLKEAGHAGQPIAEVIPRFLKNDIPGYIKAYTSEGNIDDNIEKYVYDNPDTVENYTHSKIQQELEDRVRSSYSWDKSKEEEADFIEYTRQSLNTPKYQMGGNLPGTVGNMYARTGSPSKGPRRNQTDVTDASAQNGKEMQYYQNGLDWKPKSISRDGSVIKDDRGQWDHPGEITEIGSNQITMEGVPYDVLGVSDTGDTKLMKPGKNYKFKGKKVTEYPMAKNGVNQQDQKTLQQLDQLTNFTNYNTKQPGGWLDTL